MVSVGFGVNFDDASVAVRTDRFKFSNFFDPSAASFDLDDLQNFQTQNGDESDVGYTAGVRWHTADDTFSVGATYKSGTEFPVRIQNINPITLEPFVGIPNNLSASFHVPSRFGVGVAWKHQTLTLLFDYSRVNYSELTEDLATLFSDFADVPTANQAFQLEDGNEIRFGGEWGIMGMGSSLLFVRGGLWLDPTHQLTFDDQGLTFGNRRQAELQRILFPDGDNEMHYTVGSGIAIGARAQIDVAFDYSELVSSTNASLVLRF